MYNHAPKNYNCPICKLIKGSNDELTIQEDIIYSDRNLTAFIAAKWWNNNPGHVIIIPNIHFENIYDITDEILSKIFIFVKKVAIGLKKEYQCDGISISQHNEPSGSQDLWHFHVHVFPRYKGDRLYQLYDKCRWTKPEERISYANKLREYFKTK